MNTKHYLTPTELNSLSSPALTIEQIKLINRKTPAKEITIEKGDDGVEYKSVRASYVKKCLALLFGWDYDFTTSNEQYIANTGEVSVKGRLEIRSNKTIVREQYGSHTLARKPNPNNANKSYPVNIANGYKSAASDALKKCASELGMFWDIYGREPISVPTTYTIEPPTSVADYNEQKILERLNHFLYKCNTKLDLDDTYSTFLNDHKEEQSYKDLYNEHLKRIEA